MKKKIFTLLTLLLAVCSGAWADETYTFTKSGGYTSTTLISSTNGTLGTSDGGKTVTVSVSKNTSAEAYVVAIPNVKFTYNCGSSDKSSIIQFRETGVYANGGAVHINVSNVEIGSEITLNIKSKNSTAIGLSVVSGATANANNAESFTALTSMKYTATATSVEINNPSNGFILESVTVSDPPATYTVTYKANGGIGDDVVDGAASSVAANPFTYEGHTFTGWNTAAGGDGTAYAVGASVTSDLTLYAQWIETPNYTLTYNANGGTGSMDATEGYGSINLSPIAYTKSGYSFMGWATSQANADAGTVAYADKASYSLEADATIYAVWAANDYYFAPTKTSGTASVDSEVETSTGGTMILKGTACYYQADGFLLQYTNPNSAEVDVTINNKVMQPGSVIVLKFKNPNNSKARGLKIANSGGTAKATYSEATANPVTKYYTVVTDDGLAGSNTFKIQRNENAYIQSLAVVDCVDAYDVTHNAAENGTYTIKVGSTNAVSTNTISAEGATITLAATPSDGYVLSGWNVTKTTSGDAIAVSNNSFIMPAEAVTVAPTFERGVVLTWVPTVNEAATTVNTTSTASSYTAYVANPGNLTVNDLTVTSSSKETATSKIQSTSEKDADKYISATFTVQNGYTFIPTSMEVAVTAVTEAKTIQVYVGDDNQTYTQSKNDAPTNHVYTFSNAKGYEGTVTMKIYAYGGTSGYRLGTPIKVYGRIVPVPADPTTSGEETYLTTSDNMAGWRAFYDASNSYSVDGNTKVYVADVDPKGSTITMKSIDGVPANVPVILHTSSSADSHKMTLTKETVSPFSYTGTNKLEYTTSAVSEKYRLGFGASGVGFYPYSGTPVSGAVILNVSSATARALTMVFDDSETTGISRIENSERIDNSVYNLRGQRVAQPTKGLYIVNGKKVMFK